MSGFDDAVWNQLYLSTGLILGGLLIAVISKKFLGLTETITLTALVVLPALVFLLLSGRLTDFSGFGLTAKFRNEIQKPIRDIVSVNKFMLSDEEANKGDYLTAAFIQACDRYIVIKAGVVPKATDSAFDAHLVSLARSVRASLLCGRLRAVIVLDPRDVVVGYFAPAIFAEILHLPLVAYNNASPISDGALAARLRNMELGLVFKNPIVRAESSDARKTLLPGNTNLLSALELLTKDDVNVAVITAAGGKFRGIVTRQMIVEGLVRALTDATSQDKKKAAPKN